MSKKVKQLVSKFDIGHRIVKQLGLPDPVGDALYGSERALSPAEQAAKAAEEASSATGATVPSSPTAVSDDTLAAREAQRRRQLAAAGLGGNVLTGSSGLSGGAYTSGKSLLGS